MEIPWFILNYFLGIKNFYGMVSFSGENLIVKTSKPYAFGDETFSFEIKYKDICGISFTEKDGSRNNKINMKMRFYSAPMIEIIAIDDSKQYILLYPFSRKQWYALEMELLKRNPEILILNSAEELLKNRGGIKK